MGVCLWVFVVGVSCGCLFVDVSLWVFVCGCLFVGVCSWVFVCGC